MRRPPMEPNASRMLYRLALGLAAAGCFDSGIAHAEPPAVPVILRLTADVRVPARSENQLREIAVEEGDTVSAGDLLAQIDDSEPQLELEQATLEWEDARRRATSGVEVRLARKALEVAGKELARAEVAQERYQNAISQTEMDRLRLTVQKAELELEQAELDLQDAQSEEKLRHARMKVAEHLVERRRVLAPFNGVVAEVFAEKGEWVRPGDEVLRLIQVDRLRAEGFLDRRGLAGVEVGAKVRLVIGAGDGNTKSATATIVFISPEIDPVNGQSRVWAEVANDEGRFGPGMPGRMFLNDPGPAASEARR